MPAWSGTAFSKSVRSDASWSSLRRPRWSCSERGVTARGPRARCASTWVVDGAGSEGRRVTLAGPHPNDRVDRRDPHLAVADLAGLGALDDDLDDVLDVGVVDHHLDAHLGQQRDLV